MRNATNRTEVDGISDLPQPSLVPKESYVVYRTKRSSLARARRRELMTDRSWLKL